MTAIHSASASLLARRQGKEDTLRLLRCQSRSLLHKIDMDGKMKKMAELQLSVIKEQKNRKAVESQVSASGSQRPAEVKPSSSSFIYCHIVSAERLFIKKTSI